MVSAPVERCLAAAGCGMSESEEWKSWRTLSDFRF
jgi:hypothetical protein